MLAELGPPGLSHLAMSPSSDVCCREPAPSYPGLGREAGKIWAPSVSSSCLPSPLWNLLCRSSAGFGLPWAWRWLGYEVGQLAG